MKKTELRADLRRIRAQPFVHQILDIASKYLSHDELRELNEEVFVKSIEAGVELLTDYIRQEIGLPPRGPDGWTVEEIVELEKRRIELLSRTIQIVIPNPSSPPQG